jgi:hypothetical protein
VIDQTGGLDSYITIVITVDKPTIKMIYLLGSEEQGCGFCGPFAAFLTEEDRDRYIKEWHAKYGHKCWGNPEKEDVELITYD